MASDRVKKKNRRPNLGKTQKKILLLLLSGVALGLSGSPKKYSQILKETKKEWKDIDNPSGRRSLNKLQSYGMLKEKKCRDGTIELVLSEKGKEIASELQLYNLVIPKRKKLVWDGKWRIVIFDIPERKRYVRDSLRGHLKRLGFVEIQRSVFAFPFNGLEEVQRVVDFYKIHYHVKLIVADALSNDYKLKKNFKIQSPR